MYTPPPIPYFIPPEMNSGASYSPLCRPLVWNSPPSCFPVSSLYPFPSRIGAIVRSIPGPVLVPLQPPKPLQKTVPQSEWEKYLSCMERGEFWTAANIAIENDSIEMADPLRKEYVFHILSKSARDGKLVLLQHFLRTTRDYPHDLLYQAIRGGNNEGIMCLLAFLPVEFQRRYDPMYMKIALETAKEKEMMKSISLLRKCGFCWGPFAIDMALESNKPALLSFVLKDEVGNHAAIKAALAKASEEQNQAMLEILQAHC